MHSGFRTFFVSVIVFCFNFNLLISQVADTLMLLENQLVNAYKKVMDAQVFTRHKPAEEFYDSFISCLNVEGSFDYAFENLEYIGKVYSPDHRIRIFTWNFPVGIAENRYYGIVQYYSSQHKNYKPIPLNTTDSLKHKTHTNTWDGLLYYDIIETKYAGRKYYTLLGYNLSTPLSSKKTIEVISIDDYDELYFCGKLFRYNGKPVDRIVFEYNEKAIMSLQYNENLKMIVFDHLSPSKPSLAGQYEFYGPDFTYDGLKWEKGVWVHYSNIDVTN